MRIELKSLVRSAAVVLALFTQVVHASAPAKGPDLVFEKELHDFGKIVKGVVAEYDFVYTNKGDQPVELREVRPACGCTTPQWTRTPLAPGASEKIKVKFNSATYDGPFYKSISVTSNMADRTHVLFIKGEVMPNVDPLSENPNESPVIINR